MDIDAAAARVLGLDLTEAATSVVATQLHTHAACQLLRTYGATGGVDVRVGVAARSLLRQHFAAIGHLTDIAARQFAAARELEAHLIDLEAHAVNQAADDRSPAPPHSSRPGHDPGVPPAGVGPAGPAPGGRRRAPSRRPGVSR